MPCKYDGAKRSGGRDISSAPAPGLCDRHARISPEDPSDNGDFDASKQLPEHEFSSSGSDSEYCEDSLEADTTDDDTWEGRRIEDHNETAASRTSEAGPARLSHRSQSTAAATHRKEKSYNIINQALTFTETVEDRAVRLRCK
ncbi:uncharacterized protein PHACADRAFT_254635 [Phanerochaete carnosa HHB-10118-sp]|uniref:Uncharacterized protein n=1 Tax=Phanerochaete carnosa (strain HHB-10118-sp) TaxID=650164 RepID=K5VZR8_PHACS|nr:uncharacterized protein PHACADRAFT_254635 [Phanerochaete carnosa HHB-10118-sp]EKM57083.1 hypothetical protein PHACADRAFT_254635 [Phanerochaete carnosa HHB-10118-sp]